MHVEQFNQPVSAWKWGFHHLEQATVNTSLILIQVDWGASPVWLPPPSVMFFFFFSFFGMNYFTFCELVEINIPLWKYCTRWSSLLDIDDSLEMTTVILSPRSLVWGEQNSFVFFSLSVDWIFHHSYVLLTTSTMFLKTNTWLSNHWDASLCFYNKIFLVDEDWTLFSLNHFLLVFFFFFYEGKMQAVCVSEEYTGTFEWDCIAFTPCILQTLNTAECETWLASYAAWHLCTATFGEGRLWNMSSSFESLNYKAWLWYIRKSALLLMKALLLIKVCERSADACKAFAIMSTA